MVFLPHNLQSNKGCNHKGTLLDGGKKNGWLNLKTHHQQCVANPKRKAFSVRVFPCLITHANVFVSTA